MIDKFDSLFAGHVDMDDVGYAGIPVNDRSFSDEHLASVFDKSESVDRRDRPEGPVESLPSPTSVAAVVDDEETGAVAKRLEGSSCSRESRLGSSGSEQRRRSPPSRFVKNGSRSRSRATVVGEVQGRRGLPIPHHEQAPTRLRHIEV